MDAGGPWPVTADSGPWPLHGAAAAKALEAEALSRHAPHLLMERAGLAVARLARALAPCARLVEVWCGPGNNGGDGYVAARWLHCTGTPVRLVECGAPERLPGDAAAARQAALEAGLVPTPLQQAWAAAPPGAGAPDLVIDGLLGLGTSRAPGGPIAEAIGAIATRTAPVLAIDLPSGLHPDTGQPLGTAVVRAAHTVSLLTLKPGLFTGRGRDLAGAVWFDALGEAPAGPPAAEAAGMGSDRPAPPSSPAVPSPSSPTAWLARPARRAPLPHAAHKGSRGDAWVVGGAPGMVGAAWLAARSALAAGAGRVFISTLGAGDETAGTFDPARPELMQRPLAAALAQLVDNATVVAGCGGSQAVRAVLPELLARAPRLVLDADALNHVAAAPELLRLLRGRAGRGLRTVLTPHPLEAARLLGSDSAAVQADRIAAATALAERTQCIVVLKGSGTVVAAPGRLPHINPSGNAALATAGTGDVLAGWLGGLWAQAPAGDALVTACAAVWQHGHAADMALARNAGRGAPLLAADLVATLAASA
ncbi:MAG: NAD(P)H-hydrate dehydratase [Rubrivivax sp.]|nr:NAD(P)H-hydrate dehydratase [Rubrivivax sp.]